MSNAYPGVDHVFKRHGVLPATNLLRLVLKVLEKLSEAFRRHNIALRDPGEGEGVLVDDGQDAASVSVSPGGSVDGQGPLIGVPNFGI